MRRRSVGGVFGGVFGGGVGRGAGAVAVGALVLLSGCGTGGQEDDADVVAIATTTVLGDVVGQVVSCAGGESRTLMPRGADPHDFAPSSSEVADLVRADLVVANGLGLEEGLASALESATQDGARVLEVGPELDPLPFGNGELAHDDGADEHADEATDEATDEHGSLDPHVWLDVARMARAADLVGAELSTVTGDDAYAACGAEVAAELEDLDAQVREVLAEIPEGSRLLVTDHAALGYFALAYDFDIVGVVVPGGSTLGEPSAAGLAELVDVIQETGVRALVTGVAAPSDTVEALARESGDDVEVLELYVGSLGPDGSGAETYAGMMLTNARLLADGLAD